MMNTYRSSEEISLPSLLLRVADSQANGCLQITSGTSAWLFFLRQGKLIYVSSSVDPFGRLNRHIRRLSIQIPTLVSAVRVQLRLLFDVPLVEPGATSSALFAQSTMLGNTTLADSRDYQAICWLVDQRHLSARQAGRLIEDLAKEVVGMVLSVPIDRYRLIEADSDAMPQFCQVALETLLSQPSQIHLPEPAAQPFYSRALDRPPERNVAAPEAADTADHSSSSSNRGLTPPGLPAKAAHTIACIDDSPSILNTITTFLSDKGIAVIAINDPVKALMQIIRSKPDLILLDVTMPNLDGYELCSLVRKHPHFKYTPVVMVTSNSGFIDRAKAKLVGASGFMTKPFTETDLMKMVFKHLN